MNTGQLSEDTVKLGPGQQWLKDTLPIRLQLIEDGSAGGQVVVRGEFARSGAATENKRVYPKTLWEREIKKLASAMDERRLYGELDHPTDGRTSLSRTSHIITSLSIDSNGKVIGEAMALDTGRGKDLQALLRSGCQVGVSSRGYGSTKTNQKGEEIVQEDYNLVTFDFVAEPADTSAYPKVVGEDVDKELRSRKEIQQAEDREKAKRFAERVRQEAQADEDERELKKRFEQDIISNLGEMSAAARERIRAELEADPAVAGARSALEQIVSVIQPFITVPTPDERAAALELKLRETEAKLQESERQVERLAKLAKEAGYKFYLERSLSGNPDKQAILKLLGDLTQYEAAEDLKAKLGAILDEMAAREAAEEARKEELRKRQAEIEAVAATERQRAERIEKELTSDIDKLTEALEKALEANSLLGVQLYAEQRTEGHPHKKQIRRLIEASKATSKEEVDDIIEEHGQDAPAKDTHDLEDVRARVRRLTEGGRGSTPLEEEAPRRKRRTEDDYNGLGVNLSTLRALSGMGGARRTG